LTGFSSCHSRTHTWGSATVLWRAAGSTYPQAWEREMRVIKEVNDDAFKHLIALPPRQVLILFF